MELEPQQLPNHTMLYPFQQRLVEMSHPKQLFSCDTGTGKTLIAIHHYLKYGNGMPLAIIAPPAKVDEGGWDREIKRVEERYNINIPYTMLRSSQLAKKWPTIAKQFVIVDECHQFKNPASQRGEALQHLLLHCDGFSLLSATPAANGWKDMVNYFIIFGYITSPKEFNRKYIVWKTLFFGNRQVPKIDHYTHIDELRQWTKSFSLSVKKDQVLELPPLINENVVFKASRDYQTIKRTHALGDVEFDNPAAMLQALRQHTNPKKKLAYTQLLCDGTADNIVIFYQFEQERLDILDMLKRKLKDKSVFQVNGKVHQLPTEEQKKNLRNSVTLLQYNAGSAGIECQYATQVIYYTPTYSYQDFQQSMGRVYRAGQAHKVTVFRYMTDNTIEEDVWKALSDKKDFDQKLYLATKLGF